MQIRFTPRNIQRAKAYLDDLHQSDNAKKTEKKLSLLDRIKKFLSHK